MKKNKMMRAAGALMVVTLLTLSIVSGTFAKYVTSGGNENSARVAKFGVTVAADGTLFDENYLAANDNTPAGTTPDGEKDEVANAILTVESSVAGEKVVAPGTKNDTGMSISVKGKPEVDVQVALTVDATDIYLDAKNGLPDMTTANTTDTFNNAAKYNPVKYTLTRNGAAVVTKGTLAAVEAALEGYAGRYNANTDLSTAIGEFKLTWEWAFEDSTVTDVNKKDTLLGDLAAGTTLTPALPADTAYSTSTSVAINVSVTQID